jgi:hypothetical protein
MARPRRTRAAVAPVIRFEDADASVDNVLDKIRDERFPELVNAKIKTLFDLKKRKHGGNLVLGRIQKSNDLIKKLTIDQVRGNEGYDYVLYVDKVAWNAMEQVDRERLISHELRHCFVDTEAKRPYKLVDHDIQDFVSEVSLNSADPGWALRVATLTNDIYSQDEDSSEE